MPTRCRDTALSEQFSLRWIFLHSFSFKSKYDEGFDHPKSGRQRGEGRMSNGEKAGKVDLHLVSIFIEALLDTFKRQYNISLVANSPYKTGEQKGISRDVMTLFGARSSNVNLSVALYFPDATYREIVKRMWGGDPEGQSNAAIEDGLREVVNILFNRVKGRLNTEMISTHRTVPFMALGKDLKTWYLTVGNVITVPLVFDSFTFEMELVLENV